MRALVAIAIFACGLAGVSAARASDIAIDHSDNYSARYSEYGQRAGQLVIYDNQPGVFVRAYWSAPWRHRHYFPATGKRPRIGRAENLSAPRSAPRPAQTFRRSWSNASAFLTEQPRGRQPLDAEPPQNPASLK